MSKKPIVEVRQLSAHFGERRVLEQVSFQAFENEITILMGVSGSGKTTIIKHLIGLHPVEEGEVQVLGFPLHALDEDELVPYYRRIGVLFQNGALLNSLTVAENVAIPLEQNSQLPPALIHELVRVKLRLVQLEHAAEMLPHQLSGGMHRRAGLARAIALDPPLLFCDEPSAGLDPITMAGLDKLFLQLKHQLHMSMFIVSHVLESVQRIADRIIFLQEGRVIFQGTLEEAKNSPLKPLQEFFHPPIQI